MAEASFEPFASAGCWVTVALPTLVGRCWLADDWAKTPADASAHLEEAAEGSWCQLLTLQVLLAEQ